MRLRLTRPVAVVGVTLLLAGTAVAAQQLASRIRPPASAIVTIAASAPLFNENALLGGERIERCTILENLGPQPADVTLFGTASVTDLSPWLNVELIRGTLPGTGSTGDCTGFTPDAANYGNGPGGVVFRGTLATLPDGTAGIADPTRWAVGEKHAYMVRIDYTGQNPQQGLRTVQNFHWGVTPFDNRPDEAFTDDAPPRLPSENVNPPAIRQCTSVSFRRPLIGARAISKPKQIKARRKEIPALAQLGVGADEVLSAGEDASTIPADELARRARLLKVTASRAARRMPVMVVRLTPGKNNTLAVRVGLRKNGKMQAPRRWRWVRVRINKSATKSTLRWPFTATTKMSLLRTGYNQIDLTLDRGRRGNRIKGLPRLVRRSFAFKVSDGTTSGQDCVLG